MTIHMWWHPLDRSRVVTQCSRAVSSDRVVTTWEHVTCRNCLKAKQAGTAAKLEDAPCK